MCFSSKGPLKWIPQFFLTVFFPVYLQVSSCLLLPEFKKVTEQPPSNFIQTSFVFYNSCKAVVRDNFQNRDNCQDVSISQQVDYIKISAVLAKALGGVQATKNDLMGRSVADPNFRRALLCFN